MTGRKNAGKGRLKGRFKTSASPKRADDEDDEDPTLIISTLGEGLEQKYLLKNRIVHLTGEVNTASATHVINSLRFFDEIDPKKPIRLLINSTGGNIPDGLAIIDAMQTVRCDVETYAVGTAWSMAAMILLAGAPGPALCRGACQHHGARTPQLRRRIGNRS